jgi:hypothetical protein
MTNSEMTLAERVERIEADNALAIAALAEIGDGIYRLSSPARRPPALGRIMARQVGDEVRPTVAPEEVRG